MKYFEGKTVVSAQKSNIYMLHNNIKVNRACSSIRYNRIPHNGWSNIYWMFSTSNETIIDRVKSLAILTLLNQHYLHLFSRTPPNDCFYQGTNKFTANTAISSLLIQILLVWRYLWTGAKIAGLLQLTIRTGLQTVLVLTGLLVGLTWLLPCVSHKSRLQLFEKVLCLHLWALLGGDNGG